MINFSLNLDEDIWLGLETDYRSDTNIPVNVNVYSNLANMESESDGDCFYLKAPNYIWDDGDCFEGKYWICERPG